MVWDGTHKGITQSLRNNFIMPNQLQCARSLGSAALEVRSANIEPGSHPITSLTRKAPYIITIDRWDAPSTVSATPDGQNTVMLKMELFQVGSCPASFPQMLTKQGIVGWGWGMITARPIRYLLRITGPPRYHTAHSQIDLNILGVISIL